MVSLCPCVLSIDYTVTCHSVSLMLCNYMLWCNKSLVICMYVCMYVCCRHWQSWRKQKGSLPCNGLQEHVFCLKQALDNFRNSSGKLFACFIDLADAFGSIYHDIMIREMHSAHYPDIVCDILQDKYSECTFQVKYGKCLTATIRQEKGVFQGDPFSLIVFEQGIDKWLRIVEQLYPDIAQTPNPIQGYVDDVDMVATSEKPMLAMLARTDKYVQHT